MDILTYTKEEYEKKTEEDIKAELMVKYDKRKAYMLDPKPVIEKAE